MYDYNIRVQASEDCDPQLFVDIVFEAARQLHIDLRDANIALPMVFSKSDTRLPKPTRVVQAEQRARIKTDET